MKHLVQFSSQVDEEILILIKEIAEKQGRKLQDVLDEALRDYVEKIKKGTLSPRVLEAFNGSLLTHNSLYKKLAK